jgi:hypothetical protein
MTLARKEDLAWQHLSNQDKSISPYDHMEGTHFFRSIYILWKEKKITVETEIRRVSIS